MAEVVYRKGTPADREKYIDFANMVFSCAHQPHNFKGLIPKVYADGRETDDMHNIAIRDDGSIRGMVAVMPNELRIGDTVLKTGFVGTVSTHPYGRGEGHMKALMAMAIDGMKAEGVDLAMLGGQRQRYEYFGFIKGGVSRNHRVTSTNLRHVLGNTDVSDIVIAEVAEDDMATLALCAEMHSKNPIAAKRPVEEFHIIARTWNNSLKSVCIGGEFAGYMISGGEGVSEIYLKDISMVNKVFKAYMEKYGVSAVSLSTGEFDIELNRELAKTEENISINHADMLRIFDFPKVIGALLKLKASYAPVEDGKRSFVIDGVPMTIEVKYGCVNVTEEADEDAMQLTAMEAQYMFLSLTGEEMVARLPYGWNKLPLYMSHTDAF